MVPVLVTLGSVVDYSIARKLPKTDASSSSQARPRGVNLNQEANQPESSGCCK